MQKLEQLYEGKAKKVFKTDNPDEFIIEYKDDATAGDGAKKGTIAGKGVINNEMTSILFPMIEKAGIPTHFIEKLSPTEQLVKVVTILPLEVIVRNFAAGSISKRLGLEEGTALPRIVYQQAGGKPVQYTEGPMAGHENARMQVACWAATRDAATALAKQIEDALVAAPGCTVEPIGQRVSVYEEDTGLRGARQDFSVWSPR